MSLIYPSLISADILNLQKEIERLDPWCPGYHLDIMDRHFVPNLTWGPAFIHAIAKITPKKLWVHLMVDFPELWINDLKLPEGSIVSIHFETIKNNLNIIDVIQGKKWQASIAINPKTPIEEIFPLLRHIDQALIMSVEPGFSGQQFMPDSIQRVKAVDDYRKSHNLNFRIGIDGGIGKGNIIELKNSGVDDFAAAMAIFGEKDPVAALQDLVKLAA